MYYIYEHTSPLAFVCEYVDSSLGMGYGTTLTPLLLFLGFAVLEVVPAILLSELFTGFLAGAFHHMLGNVTFSRQSDDSRVVAVLSICGVVGSVVAVFLTISLPQIVVKIYMGYRISEETWFI